MNDCEDMLPIVLILSAMARPAHAAFLTTDELKPLVSLIFSERFQLWANAFERDGKEVILSLNG
jgi:hypothetical protein